MKYMGSKARVAREILPIMLDKRSVGQWWVEPFVGGGNTICRVDGNRLGADINRYAVEALVSIRDFLDELPQSAEHFTEEDYKALRHSDEYKHKGYAGFVFSYGGKWMGGWRRDSVGKRDYVAEGYRAAVKQSPLLDGVRLVVGGYDEIHIPQNSIIYCDPPYSGTTAYTHSFDSDSFWSWCRGAADNGHTVFVSEYSAPDGFECVWKKDVASSLAQDTGSKRGVERLFVCK